ncbi:Senescence-associated carboxylesterase 101 [Vitis vinifera]|uniref:Senescence-associated carboxylesterase 101 n=1 Tax=Vitis vinifera TaxID=29760 RepID=A0A438DX46_VITVI|nr:Senescence-associated carboxylesterase 101 [Vitis vinifera]
MSTMGYYDSFRNLGCKRDIKMNRWEDMVEHVERKPHQEGAALQTLWICTGTNYRKMVEPLDIAAYNREGGRKLHNQWRI